MIVEASLYPQEERRVATLRSLNLLDTPLDVRFERVTRLVRSMMDVPIAIFNLIDENRQHYKSVQGLNAVDAPKPLAFCTHALLEEQMLHVPDAKKDSRFEANPFVTGELLDIGFYAGCPVRAPDGMPIGTLCAIDTKPRKMSAEKLQSLRDLADIIEMDLRVSDLSNAQKALIDELDTAKRMAMIDPLTRLWNRNGLDALLSKAMNEAIREDKKVTVVLADIDHFKKVNDMYGHPAGDAVLIATAKRLLENLRVEDVIGRYGGEEFMIVLLENNYSDVHLVLERLRSSVEKYTIPYDGELYSVTMSFGAVTRIPDSVNDTQKMIKQADDLLYVAKKDGRNCIRHEEIED